jgi:hypothetical protein
MTATMTAFCVFSGRDRRQAEAAEVFRHSVHEHASAPVEVDFVSADNGWCQAAGFRRRGVTAFSFARFLAPWICDYEGRALYADGCDMLCLGDVTELASFDLDGRPLAVVKHPPIRLVPRETRARSWTSLMLMDCGHPRMKRWTPEYIETAPDGQLMHLLDFKDDEIGDLPPEWNTLVAPGCDPPDGTKIAHWSALSNPDIGSWINASGSLDWAEARERWRAA